MDEHLAGEVTTRHVIEITPATHYSELAAKVNVRKGGFTHTVVYCIRPSGKIPFFGKHSAAQKLANKLEKLRHYEGTQLTSSQVTLSRSLSAGHAHSFAFHTLLHLLHPISRLGSLGIVDVILEVETKPSQTKTTKSDEAKEAAKRTFEQKDEEIRRKIVDAVKKLGLHGTRVTCTKQVY